MKPVPVDKGWREKVEETIERLEKRAAAGELYAQLCLKGWYAELARIKEVQGD